MDCATCEMAEYGISRHTQIEDKDGQIIGCQQPEANAVLKKHGIPMTKTTPNAERLESVFCPVCLSEVLVKKVRPARYAEAARIIAGMKPDYTRNIKN